MSLLSPDPDRLSKWGKRVLPLAGVFLLQFFMAELLSIRMVRPDFLLIYIIYTGIKEGRFTGVVVGFTLGLLADLVGVGSYFGLSPLMYSLTGYLCGFLKGKYARFHPFYFHLFWVGITLVHFFIFTYVRFQFLFETDLPVFWGKWIYTCAYTLGFLGILQVIMPLKRIS